MQRAAALAAMLALAAGAATAHARSHAAPPCGAVPPQAAAPSPRPHYEIALGISSPSLLTGTERVTFPAPKPVDRIVLRLWPNSPGSGGSRLTVAAVRTPGLRSTVQRTDPTTLVVRLARPARRATVQLAWTLRVQAAGDGRIDAAGGNLRLGTFLPLLAWNGRAWALDPPTPLRVETFTSPAADWDVRVSAPKGTAVALSGRPLGHGRWRATAVRDLALVSGRFTTAAETAMAPRPVRVIALRSSASGGPPAAAWAARAKAALEALAARYGPYPWPELRIALFPDLGRGGIEYPTLIFQGDESFERATTHEVAHQWFYSLVGNDQAHDPWLDEGLASWAQAQVDGIFPYFQSVPIPPVASGAWSAPVSFYEDKPTAYFPGVYAQTVQALDALGDRERVDCALRVYAARNAYRTATVGDLVEALARYFDAAALRRFGDFRG